MNSKKNANRSGLYTISLLLCLINVFIIQFSVLGQQGPRLTDAQFFKSLNLDYKGLEKVKLAVQKNDLETAKIEFADYLRHRAGKYWWFSPQKIESNIEFDKRKADDAIVGKIRVAHYEYAFPDSVINWRFNATENRTDVAFTKEWQWQLGRMYFWPDMGDAYWATGNEKYAKAWVQQLRGWINQCPYPENGNDKSWRTIECGDRMGKYWPASFFRFLLSPSVNEDDLIWYVKSCVEQGQHLRKYLPRGNWLTYSMNGLFTIGTSFPELNEAEAWRRFAIDTMAVEMGRQWFPDGVYTEYSPSYHQTARKHILEIYDKAMEFGYENEIPNGFMELIERSFEYDMYSMSPTGNMPEINDSYPSKANLNKAAELFPDREDFKWFSTNREKGNPPLKASHAFDYGGLYVMRSGWEEKANLLIFDTGPLVTMHEHQDKLHLMLWAYGREMLYDGGGGIYENSKFRPYSCDTYSHNTVLVDGKPQRRSGGHLQDALSANKIDAKWESNKKYDYARGVFDGPYAAKVERPEDNTDLVHFPNFWKDVIHPAIHERQIFFLKPDVFVVYDILKSLDDKEHTFQARWHLHSVNTVFEDLSVLTQDENLPNLAVVPLIEDDLQVFKASAQHEPEILGWENTKNGYIPTTTILHTKKGKTCEFLTLLLPLKNGVMNSHKTINAVGDSYIVVLEDGKTIEIKTDDRKLRVARTN
jgi:hypothetical protein